ncbi:copper amine oxidase [Halobacillus fulvus]|nr:copper amine oxidase [Halobacillus fulvus]
MKKNVRNAFLAVPLSMSLLIPTTLTVSADDHSAPTVETEAVELRSTLDNLLSEHAYLAVETMRKGAEGAADFEASANALSANTDDLSGAIESVYGAEAGEQFKQMWSEHIGYFVDYVTGTAEGDEEKKQMALDELNQYRQDFSQFLETATGERLEAGALAEGLQMHVNQLIGAFDSYVAGDYEKAYEYEREAIKHMYGVSKGLSNAIVTQFPEEFNNTEAVTPAADLRSSLNHLLSEHAGLAAMAMQNGIDGSEDFDASVQALSNNTDDLSAAIAGLYGEEAGEQFKQMWSDHIGNFVTYVEGTAAEDEAKKEEALQMLTQYRADFSNFLETATEGRLDADVLSGSLQEHVNQLVGTFDSYVGEDYPATYEQLRTAYAHMFGASKALSSGFVAQFPDQFQNNMPSEMPDTGLGGMADSNSNVWIFASILALLATTTLFVRRASKQ